MARRRHDRRPPALQDRADGPRADPGQQRNRGGSQRTTEHRHRRGAHRDQATTLPEPHGQDQRADPDAEWGTRDEERPEGPRRPVADQFDASRILPIEPNRDPASHPLGLVDHRGRRDVDPTAAVDEPHPGFEVPRGAYADDGPIRVVPVRRGCRPPRHRGTSDPRHAGHRVRNSDHEERDHGHQREDPQWVARNDPRVVRAPTAPGRAALHQVDDPVHHTPVPPAPSAPI